jgi:hypothetical protein
MSDIEISLKWSKELYLKGAKTAYDLQMRESWRRYAGWFFIALFQFGVVGALRANSFGLLLLSSFLLIYWYYLRWYIRKIFIEKSYEKSKFKDKELQISLEEEGICIDGICTPWREFTRAVSTKSGYLLDLNDAFLFIPSDAFANKDDKSHFYTILKENLKTFIRFQEDGVRNSR